MGTGTWSSRRRRYAREIAPQGGARSILYRPLVDLARSAHSGPHTMGRFFRRERILMSYARQAEAMDAVIGAGLGADPVRLHHPDGAACPGGRSAVPVDPRYATLLSRILASSSTAGAQCVQFVACGARAQATGVALAAARTAASLIGRSLVINARLAWDADSFEDGKAGCADSGQPFVPRLYHQWLAQSPADLALLFGSARRAAFNAVISPFRFVAIDCPSPSLAPAASALAPFCLGYGAGGAGRRKHARGGAGGSPAYDGRRRNDHRHRAG